MAFKGLLNESPVRWRNRFVSSAMVAVLGSLRGTAGSSPTWGLKGEDGRRGRCEGGASSCWAEGVCGGVGVGNRFVSSLGSMAEGEEGRAWMAFSTLLLFGVRELRKSFHTHEQ